MLKGVPAAFVALVVGLIAAGIAYRQYRVAKEQLQFDLRAARLAVYRRVKIFLRHILYAPTITRDLYTDFNEACAEADFLFSDDVRRWLNELQNVAAHCMSLQEPLENIASDADINSINKLQGELDELTGRLRTANDLLRDKFANHLS
jgi:hypothetical protein